MADTFWGIGKCLFWHRSGNMKLGWRLPLPPSRVLVHESHLQFRIGVIPMPFALASTHDMLFSDIGVVRKHNSRMSYFTFIGQTGGSGFRLAFMPYCFTRFENMVSTKLPFIDVEVITGWRDHNEDDDRIKYRLPDWPSG